jgi:hypothetical protein
MTVDWGVVFGLSGLGVGLLSMDLMNVPTMRKMYYEAVPNLPPVLLDEDGNSTFVILRNAIDGLQDMYFLRKRGIVEDYQWRNWMTAFTVLGRLEATRAVYDNAVSRSALDPEFLAFLAPLFDGRQLADPKEK